MEFCIKNEIGKGFPAFWTCHPLRERVPEKRFLYRTGEREGIGRKRLYRAVKEQDETGDMVK
jgi:hypothetical protein